MAQFVIRGRQGPGDVFRKDGEVEAPVKPDGSHFLNALNAHIEQIGNFTFRQFLVVHKQTGDAKPFNARLELVIKEG